MHKDNRLDTTEHLLTRYSCDTASVAVWQFLNGKIWKLVILPMASFLFQFKDNHKFTDQAPTMTDVHKIQKAFQSANISRNTAYLV